MPSDSYPADPPSIRTDLYHGLFSWHPGADGRASVSQLKPAPTTIPCPTTGRPLRVATIEAQTPAICPRCEHQRRGGFVSFVGDLRMAYACPECQEFVWLAGV